MTKTQTFYAMFIKTILPMWDERKCWIQSMSKHHSLIDSIGSQYSNGTHNILLRKFFTLFAGTSDKVNNSVLKCKIISLHFRIYIHCTFINVKQYLYISYWRTFHLVVCVESISSTWSINKLTRFQRPGFCSFNCNVLIGKIAAYSGTNDTGLLLTPTIGDTWNVGSFFFGMALSIGHSSRWFNPLWPKIKLEVEYRSWM